MSFGWLGLIKSGLGKSSSRLLLDSSVVVVPLDLSHSVRPGRLGTVRRCMLYIVCKHVSE